MLLLGPHIPFLHQVLQLIGLEASLACHYIWLPNTLPVLKQHPIRHNLRVILLSGTTLRIYRQVFRTSISVNYCYVEHSKQPKQPLLSLLTTHNLSHTVHFATRIQNDSSTATDNLWVTVG